LDQVCDVGPTVVGVIPGGIVDEQIGSDRRIRTPVYTNKDLISGIIMGIACILSGSPIDLSEQYLTAGRKIQTIRAGTPGGKITVNIDVLCTVIIVLAPAGTCWRGLGGQIRTKSSSSSRSITLYDGVRHKIDTSLLVSGETLFKRNYDLSG
jgi:hypothetical protein